MKLNEILNVDRDVEEFKTNFHEFMSSTARNQWIAGGSTLSAYVRKGVHMIGDTRQFTLDIANIEVTEEARGRGIGGNIINWMHDQNPFNTSYVESILNLELYRHLLQNGWSHVPRSAPPSVYKNK